MFFSMSKSATSIALDFAELALLLFGLMLVVGLIGEYAKSEKWKKHLRLFELFVIIGVAGELLADGGIFLFSKHLQTIADIEIARLTKEAGDAKSSAESAASASSQPRLSADEANAAAGEAKEKAETAARLADGAARNLSLTQYLVSARIVPDPKALADQLKPFKGEAVILRSYIGDLEGWGLCGSLWSIARSAGMQATDECGIGPLTVPIMTPMAVSGPDVQETERIGEIISRTGRLGVTSGFKAPQLTIFVGVKSPFAIGPSQSANVASNKSKKAGK